MFGFILRESDNFKDIKPIKILYTSFACSHLQYASQVINLYHEAYASRKKKRYLIVMTIFL